MTRRRSSREKLRAALLDREKTLHDLRAALAALTVMASAPDGIETGDMAGLRFVARSARELAASLHHVWRHTIQHLVGLRSSQA